MKKRLTSILIILCMMLTLLPAPVQAAGTTKTINAGTFTLEISKVYAMDSKSSSKADGYFTTYCIVVPASAVIKCTKMSGLNKQYIIAPFNEIAFTDGPMYPEVKEACDYEDFLQVEFTKGTSITVAKNNVYYFSGGSNYRYYNVNVYTVDDEKLLQFGGSKPTKKPASYLSAFTAVPSTTDFVVQGKGRNTVNDAPQLVTQAYTINQANYLQLRAFAILLNRTAAQFDLGLEGKTIVIKPGKPFSDTLIGHKIQKTTDVRSSTTKFKLNDKVFSFADARTIGGFADYIELIDFAKKLDRTASQFNVYRDDAKKQTIIQPGVPYTGMKYEAPVTVLKQITGDEELLPDGDYYMQISGKFIYPVPGGQYWLELRDKRPDKPFNIKLASNSQDSGPKYSIAYAGTYIMLGGSLDGKQLESTTSSTPHYWRINRYSSFCTIRDYKNQKLIVKASGKTRTGNTTVIGSISTGSAPDNAKITFLTEAVSNNLKTVVYMLSYPKKVTYKIGEGFDATGLKAAI